MSLLGLISFANIFIKVLMCVFNFSPFWNCNQPVCGHVMKVDFEDRKYWKTQKCNNLIKPADLLAKSTSDVLCNFVFIFHWDDGIISMNFYPIRPGRHTMNFYPIWPVFHARSNLTGHEILVKLGVNSLRLHLYACLYIVWLPGQIWWS